jgi:hemolysin III
MLTGGLLYTIGAVVYATKKPDPSPRWFGYHEVFHALTIGAWLAFYIGIAVSLVRS